MAINFPDSPVNGDTHVVGNVTYVYDNAKDKWNGAGQTPNDRLTEGSNKLEIDANNNLVYSGGNFAVGTSTANNTLTLYGDSSSSLRISKSGVLAYDHTFDGSTYIIANNNGSSGIDIVFGTKTAGAESLRITSAGQSTFIKRNNNADDLLFGYGTSTGIYAGIGGFNNFNTNQLCDLTFWTNGSTSSCAPTEKLRITSGGNVGINRTDPDQKLNVSGCAEFNAYDNAGGSNGYYTSKGLIIGNLYDAGKSYTGSDDRTACVWQERGLDLDFATNDELRMKITYEGVVGIGTATPSVTNGNGLHIAGANSGIKIQNTANTGWAYIEYTDESNTTKFTQGYRDVNEKYSIRPGASLALADSGVEVHADGTTKTNWFTCALTGKTVNASNTAVLTINGYNPTFVQVYIKANFGANGALQAHFDYELITCDAQGSGGTTAIRQSLNESVGSFQISTSDFAVTKSGTNVIITYTNQASGVNQITFYVKGLFNSLSLA